MALFFRNTNCFKDGNERKPNKNQEIKKEKKSPSRFTTLQYKLIKRDYFFNLFKIKMMFQQN